MQSLKVRLLTIWALSLLASVAVGLLLYQLYQQSFRAQIGREEAVIARACDLIRGRYGFYTAGWTGPVPALTDPALRRSLAAVVDMAVARQSGVAGGIWQSQAGPLTALFPAHPGLPSRSAVSDAERAQIEAVNRAALQEDQAMDHRSTIGRQTLLLHACPLPGPIPDLTAWTMAQVHASPGFGPLRLGLGVLFALMLLLSAWVGRTLLVWSRHVRTIEAALMGVGPQGMPWIRPTGERELDRIIGALNEAGARLAAARQHAQALAERVARAERMAGLGRVAAGVAHEIRNPIAAARLQGENALAGNDARRQQAIGAMLTQLGRLDGLVGELLAMTQRIDPRPEPVALDRFLADCAARHEAMAAERGVAVTVRDAGGTALLDPRMIGRLMDNLLGNAIRHAPPNGRVSVSAERESGALLILVEDNGGGVPPDLAPRLFEPFVTGRADGTGLGLAIARELADAHGGRLSLRRAGGEHPGAGAVFALELPQETTCRPS